MTADLLAFLRARLDEDGRVVQRLDLANEDSQPYEWSPSTASRTRAGRT